MNKALSLYRELHEAGVSCFLLDARFCRKKAATIELMAPRPASGRF